MDQGSRPTAREALQSKWFDPEKLAIRDALNFNNQICNSVNDQSKRDLIHSASFYLGKDDEEGRQSFRNSCVMNLKLSLKHQSTCNLTADLHLLNNQSLTYFQIIQKHKHWNQRIS